MLPGTPNQLATSTISPTGRLLRDRMELSAQDALVLRYAAVAIGSMRNLFTAKMPITTKIAMTRS